MMPNPQIRFMALLVLALCSATLLVEAQYPARLSIPGAVPVPALQVAARPQFRSESRVVRLRRPTALPRLIEEPKPVTESEEEDTIPDAFLPSLLREQQLAQAQQAQFHQAAAAFLNGGDNGGLLQETQPTLLQDEEAPLTLPTRFVERPQPQQVAALPPPPQPLRPAFNDYGIGTGLGSAAGQRFGSTAATPASAPQPQSPPQRFNIVRSRPARPHYEAQAAPAPAPAPAPAARPRPKPIQPRPIIDQNQLQQEDRGNGEAGQRGRRPVAQTLRKWRDENEDGSITWGYENDDGSFKEELIGTDCITKGTYGYIDPDGNKREYHYETGIKCDPNARDAEEEDLDDNGFINYEENKAVLPNGIEIDMTQLGKRKSKRPGANNNNYRN